MTAVELRCPNCAQANAPGARFCSNCGAALGEAAPPQEERKLVSVLFVDLVDSTARADRADPEDVREVLQAYHREAKECIEQYGGVVEKFIGDAVMAVFGAPIAHGDDAERAVRAGLRVLEVIDLPARAAVSTGDAIVSVDNARSGDALATGDVVNTAARLQNAAPVGRVIVGEETYRATRQSIRYEPLEAIAAKGKADPIETWLAVEPKTAPADRPLGAMRLVGRDRELEVLRSVWGRAMDERRPHLVTLVGPPGIGKSRLCREIATLAGASGGRILRGRCLPYEERSGYQAFSRIVHDLSGILESDSPAAARPKLEAIVAELIPEGEAVETLRHLLLLLGLAPDDEVASGALLMFAARRFIECVALAQPTVFVFEDVHWADASELALLGYLAQHTRDAPALLVATARPELLDIQPTWGTGLGAQTTMPLEPLPEADARALAELLVVGVDPDRIVDIAGGNPLFLEELAASIAERGGEELPVTVREAIAARIDALPARARDALLTAAVIGKTFWRGILESVGSVDDIDGALSVLEARDFVRRDPASQVAGEAQFTFKHMLIREVAYATVPRVQRRERHAAVARYIEGHLVGEALATILAYHWREAGEPARAVPYLLAAAEAARRGWAQSAVVDLYSRALDLTDDHELRRQIRLRRGVALVELHDYGQASEELRALLPELAGAEKLDALIALGIAEVWSERDAEAIAVAEQAMELAEELGDETGIPAALAGLSEGLAMRGGEGDLDRALELGDRALELWVPGSRKMPLTHILHLHANATAWRGEYERSAELSRRTRELAADVHSADSLLRGGGLEAVAHVGLGRHERAIAIYDELFELARDQGRPVHVLLNYSSIVFREVHDLEEARTRTSEAVELSAQWEFGMPKQFAGSDLIQTYLLAGDIGAAQSEWPKRWERTAEATGWTTWLIAGRLLAARAEIALEAETPEEAAEWAQRAVDVSRRTRRAKYEARSLSTLGQALARLGRPDEALAALRTAVEIADRIVSPYARWNARAALGRAAYAVGRDDDAATAYGEAREIVDAFGAALAPERQETLARSPVVQEIRSA
jgi:class 3 adenylate cyclase/tetratricopeptide (TPR) repeat protein